MNKAFSGVLYSGSMMSLFTKCLTTGCEVRWLLILIFLIHILVLGYSVSNAASRSEGHFGTQSKKPFAKRVCVRPPERLNRLTQPEDFVADYSVHAGRANHLLLAEEEYDKHDEDYEGYEVREGVETDLDKQFPGCGPPVGVEAKVVNETSFNVTWYAEAPKNISIRYFMVDFDQAKRENKTEARCRQRVEPESDIKNKTHSFHSYTFTNLTTDRLYQFRVVTYYFDYQIYSSPNTSWIRLK
ncbi:unnamed protein product [Bemisia tabaci]|uniref:Fibronectin type-III domain-containing protein n=1 Tax=Bemisia tabaci TaxID=7038 RepID=A0A9P0A1R8_BEMTA|nr:unnamed protein product [Bemisia tabaci]